MLGGQLQDEDIPPGGLDDNFVLPGFENNQIEQDNQHLQLDQGNNPIPDLNLDPHGQQQEGGNQQPSWDEPMAQNVEI